MYWLSALAIFFSMGLYGVLHSWMASSRLKSWLERHFPDFYRRYYRLFYNIISVVTLLPVGALLILLPELPWYRIPAPWIYVTGGIQLLAGVLLLVALLQTGLREFLGLGQIFSGPPSSETLNTGGMYRVVRHPAYSLGLVIIWLFPFMTSNFFALFLASTIYILVGAVLEEKKLHAQFPGYETYQNQVPMFLPKFRK